jgi:hypothetical protein
MMVSRLETYPNGAKDSSHLDGYYSVTPTHTHEINTARVRAIKMHNPLGMIDTFTESRGYHDAQWMLLISITTVHLYGQLA